MTVRVCFLIANQVAAQLNVLSRSNIFWMPATVSSLGVAVNVDVLNLPVNAIVPRDHDLFETFS